MTLGVDGASIKRFIDAIEEEARALIKEITTLSIWGSLSTDVVWEMTHLERVVLSDAIKERTETLYGKKGIARSRGF